MILSRVDMNSYFVWTIFLGIFWCVNSSSLTKRQTWSCTRTEFRCNNGQCIPVTDKCDGIAHCSDRSDETERECANGSQMCPAYAFQCTYGACISKPKRCNGEVDCMDGSDEKNCPGSSYGSSGDALVFESEENSQGNRDPQNQRPSSRPTQQHTTARPSNQRPVNNQHSNIPFSLPTSNPRPNFDQSTSFQVTSNNQRPSTSNQRPNSGESFDRPTNSNENFDQRPNTQQSNFDRPTNNQRPSFDQSNHRPSQQPSQTTFDDATSNFGQENGAGCQVELPIGGDAFIDGNSEPLKPQVIVPHRQKVVYKCIENYFIVLGQTENTCRNGQWEYAMPSCEPRCNRIDGVTIEVKCLINDRPTECEDLSAPGTRAQITCRTGFTRELRQQNLTCTDYGRWNKLPARCNEICGKPTFVDNSTRESFVGDIAEAPWHVGIYANDEYQCGGTIISPKVVVSAAHCFWDTRSDTLRDTRDYRIVAGKTFRDLNRHERRQTQALTVDRVIHDPQYSINEGNYVRDIAFVILKDNIEFQEHIAPVCFQYDFVNQLAISSDFEDEFGGQVAGWGALANANASRQLKIMRVRTISKSECKKVLQENLVTNDKFCAGDAQRSTVCNGDSGGGFTFNDRGKHYLRGVVSVGGNSACGRIRYTTFTNVQWYTNLIRDFLIDFYRSLL